MFQIENLLQPSKAEYLNCICCGLCLAVSPTYREHLSETASPRSRVALSRKGQEGELELSPNLAGQMYACFDCMACNDICPVGIRPADLAFEMRHSRSRPPHQGDQCKVWSSGFDLRSCRGWKLAPKYLFDKRYPKQWNKVQQMVKKEFSVALDLDLGGTLSREHDVRALKRPYMEEALGSVSIELQKRIKHAFDPHNIFNPGKIFPD